MQWLSLGLAMSVVVLSNLGTFIQKLELDKH